MADETNTNSTNNSENTSQSSGLGYSDGIANMILGESSSIGGFSGSISDYIKGTNSGDASVIDSVKNAAGIKEIPADVTIDTIGNYIDGNSEGNGEIYNPYTDIKEVKKVSNIFDYWIQKPKVIAETVLKNPSITCSLTIPVQQVTGGKRECITTTIPFYMSNDFTLGLTSEYESLVNEDSLLGFANNALRLLENPQAQTMAGSTEVRLHSRAMSAQAWIDSKLNDFSVECLFVCTRREVNPVYIMRLLSACCLPRRLTSADSFPAADIIHEAQKAVDFIADVGIAGVKTVSDILNDGHNGVKNYDSKDHPFVSAGANFLKDVGSVAGDGIKWLGTVIGSNQFVKNTNDYISEKAADFQKYYNSATKTDIKTDALSGFTEKLKGENSFEAVNGIITGAITSGVEQIKAFSHGVGYVAPLEYGLIMETTEGTYTGDIVPIPNTTVTLQIGDWFRADELIVTGISGITFSKELVAPYSGLNGKNPKDLYDNTPTLKDSGGYPLYAKCTINLRPVTRVDYAKFQSYFIKGNWNAAKPNRELAASTDAYQTLSKLSRTKLTPTTIWKDLKNGDVASAINDTLKLSKQKTSNINPSVINSTETTPTIVSAETNVENNVENNTNPPNQ